MAKALNNTILFQQSVGIFMCGMSLGGMSLSIHGEYADQVLVSLNRY